MFISLHVNPAGLMTETQVFELMKHKSGGMLAVDRFGFITRQGSDQVSDKVQQSCMAAARGVVKSMEDLWTGFTPMFWTQEPAPATQFQSQPSAGGEPRRGTSRLSKTLAPVMRHRRLSSSSNNGLQAPAGSGQLLGMIECQSGLLDMEVDSDCSARHFRRCLCNCRKLAATRAAAASKGSYMEASHRFQGSSKFRA
jgi:hypothetical protein